MQQDVKKPLSIVFASNCYTIHQIDLSEALYRQCEGKYTFIETVLGENQDNRYGLSTENVPFLKQYFDPAQKAECDLLLQTADVVLIGSAPDALIRSRLRENKLTFRYSERLFKEKLTLRTYPHAMASVWLHHGRYRFRPLYMLCASAFTAADCRRFGNYRNRTYQWGYFPKTICYPSVNSLLEQKEQNKLLWCGRLIDWKHPEAALVVARYLKDHGCSFSMDMIGEGVMRSFLQEQIAHLGLTAEVRLLGAIPPQKVREEMERASVFLFTSDRGEGWGAVLNEAMNSGCAVVASHAIGSVPFLLEDGRNGRIYRDGDLEELCAKTHSLLQQPEERERLGRAAYETIQTQWNAEAAAKRFLALAEAILRGEKKPQLFADGPCSRAEILKDAWYPPENGRGETKKDKR
ncbi:MAG: glycosyltransferase [Firmicutes bacterium]|nr:glycosyltransferase [Bacillota bacterium]